MIFDSPFEWSKNHHRPKALYRVQNWPEYNRALVSRGSLTLWLDDDVLQGWRARGGKGRRYSDMAIRAVDATGLKVFGAGKWHMRQHRKGKRRV